MAVESNTERGSTSAIEHGIDVETYRQFVEFARENPGAVEGKLRAVGEYEGTAYHSAAHLGRYRMGGEESGAQRDYTLHIGVPWEFEEATGFLEPVDRMESVEVALGALATCVTNTISQAALLAGLDVEHIRTSVSAPIDLRVLLGIVPAEERETVFGTPRIDVDVDGATLTRAERDRLASMVDRSPMYALVTLAHPVEPTVTVSGAGA